MKGMSHSVVWLMLVAVVEALKPGAWDTQTTGVIVTSLICVGADSWLSYKAEKDKENKE